MAITVILHTVNGDVRTAYGPSQVASALEHIAEYLVEGKNFSVEQKKF